MKINICEISFDGHTEITTKINHSLQKGNLLFKISWMFSKTVAFILIPNYSYSKPLRKK